MESIFNFLEEVENIIDSMTGEAEVAGEISEELKNELDALEIDTNAKIEQLCLKYKEREYLAAAKKAEAKKLSEDAAIMERANERLADYIFYLLDGKKFESARAKVTYRTNPPAVKIINEADIPAEFWKPGKPTISKTAIKDAINAGKEVPGALLETGKKSAHIA